MKVVRPQTTDEVVRSQADAAGTWLELGLYYIVAGQAVSVELLDQTAEPTGSRAVVFDAVQWVPVPLDEVPNPYNAAQVGAAYDIAVAGETAVLTFTVQNTGLLPWQDSEFVLAGDAENTKLAPAVFSIAAVIPPGGVVTYTVSLPVTGTLAVLTVAYQMQRDGQAFGARLSGQVFVLPPELRQIEDGVRKQIDDWQSQGQQAVEDLLKQIQDAIQKEIETQARKQVDQFCGGAASTLGVAGVILWQTGRRRRR
ncbi:MAG: hypothetical protein KA764_10125 [Anaerolineales bacterium]|nr:hypothetical protein [Anaerolineales bacterium]